jgi:hypothetical protein
MPYYIPLTIVFITHPDVGVEPVNTMFDPDTNTPNETPDVEPKSTVVVSV